MSKKTLFFIAAVAVQVIVVALVPAKKIYTLQTGKQITIRTMPVDPYDFLSGYHVVLNYEISRPPYEEPGIKTEGTAYVILTEGPEGIWHALSAHPQWPKEVPEGAVVIRGKQREWRGYQFGIESFFIPEKDRGRIERDLRENARKAMAEIKVDRFGRAALLRLRIEDRIYEY